MQSNSQLDIFSFYTNSQLIGGCLDFLKDCLQEALFNFFKNSKDSQKALTLLYDKL